MKATCTWGDGPDVLIVLDGTRCIIYEDPDKTKWKHGLISQGSLDLTAKEARKFAHTLLQAAVQAEKLNKGLIEMGIRK